MKFSELKKVLINKYDWVKNHTWFNDKVLINEIISAVEENSKTEIEQLSKDYELEMKRHYTTIQELKATIEEKNKAIDKVIESHNKEVDIRKDKESEIGEYRREMLRSDNIITELRAEVKELKERCPLTKENLNYIGNKQIADQKEIDILKHSLKSCEGELNRVNESYSNRIIIANIELERLKSTVKILDALVIDRNNYIATLSTEAKEIKSINNQLQSRLTYLERNNEGYSVPPFMPIGIYNSKNFSHEPPMNGLIEKVKEKYPNAKCIMKGQSVYNAKFRIELSFNYGNAILTNEQPTPEAAWKEIMRKINDERYNQRLAKLARNGFTTNEQSTEFINNGHVIMKGWVVNAADEDWDFIMKACRYTK